MESGVVHRSVTSDMFFDKLDLWNLILYQCKALCMLIYAFFSSYAAPISDNLAGYISLVGSWNSRLIPQHTVRIVAGDNLQTQCM